MKSWRPPSQQCQVRHGITFIYLWLFDTYLLKLWKQSLCIYSLWKTSSFRQIMTSLTSKQSILIKVVRSKATFHGQQSDGVDGFTWNKQHYSRLSLLRYSSGVKYSAYLGLILSTWYFWCFNIPIRSTH